MIQELLDKEREITIDIFPVDISWVSFWLNREATSDRISLGNSREKEKETDIEKERDR